MSDAGRKQKFCFDEACGPKLLLAATKFTRQMSCDLANHPVASRSQSPR